MSTQGPRPKLRPRVLFEQLGVELGFESTRPKTGNRTDGFGRRSAEGSGGGRQRLASAKQDREGAGLGVDAAVDLDVVEEDALA